MFSPSRLLAIALITTGCGPSNAKAPIAVLPPGTDPIVSPVGEATDAVWLGGQRWVIIAPQDKAVSLVDFAGRTIGPFGGARGAREYQQPFHIFRTGDSVAIDDWQMRRTTIWSLDGKMIGIIPAVNSLRGALPRARDGAGRWYFELRPLPGPEGAGNRDSAFVVRTESDFSEADTVIRLAPLDVAEVISEGRRRFERRLLSGQDRWGVLPDGSLWVGRVQQNRVDWVGSDQAVHRGPELPDQVFPVREPDRELFLRRFPQELRATAEQIPFAAIKPPFEAAFTTPAGQVWLVKSRAVGDSLRSNQVVGRDGHLAREVRHHGHGRVLAVSQSAVLLTEPFEGGIRLYQIALPQATPGQ